MTAASPGPGPNLFSSFSNGGNFYRTRREAFVFSLLGQAAILGVIVYFSSCVIRNSPDLVHRVPRLDELPLIFSGTMEEAEAITIRCRHRVELRRPHHWNRKSSFQP